MPNWCNNILSIEKGKNDLKPFLKDFSELSNDSFIFESLIGSTEDYSLIYGTKWDVSKNEITNIDEIDESMSLDDKFIQLIFFTAWSPCLGFTQKLSEKYGLSINHFYSESGCDFSGSNQFVNGEEIDSIEYQNYLHGIYENDQSEFEYLLSELIETNSIDKSTILGFTFLSNSEKMSYLEELENDTE